MAAWDDPEGYRRSLERKLSRVRELMGSTYEGAVMSNERYGEGFHDGWRIAMSHVCEALGDQ